MTMLQTTFTVLFRKWTTPELEVDEKWRFLFQSKSCWRSSRHMVHKLSLLENIDQALVVSESSSVSDLRLQVIKMRSSIICCLSRDEVWRTAATDRITEFCFILVNKEKACQKGIFKAINYVELYFLIFQFTVGLFSNDLEMKL